MTARGMTSRWTAGSAAAPSGVTQGAARFGIGGWTNGPLRAGRAAARLLTLAQPLPSRAMVRQNRIEAARVALDAADAAARSGDIVGAGAQITEASQALSEAYAGPPPASCQVLLDALFYAEPTIHGVLLARATCASAEDAKGWPVIIGMVLADDLVVACDKRVSCIAPEIAELVAATSSTPAVPQAEVRRVMRLANELQADLNGSGVGGVLDAHYGATWSADESVFVARRATRAADLD